MDISLEKWLVMAALTALSIILGLIPYFIIRYTKSSLKAESTMYSMLLTILSCFGGGVLFSTAVLHVLPEVRDSMLNVPEIWETFDDHFPVAEMIMLCGFALIYLVEEIAHFIMVDGHHGHHHHTNTVARHNSIAHGIPIPNTRGSRLSLAPSYISVDNINSESNHNNRLSVSVKLQEVVIPPMTQDEECPDDKINITSSLRAFLALIALSFHAIAEGVAIGVQTSTGVWVMFGAIASHKFVMSFCMGMELMASQARLITYVGSIVFFAVVSPLGIIIGSIISDSNKESTDNLTVVVIECLVCGTLLYVVFFEILNRERERKNYFMTNSRAVGFIQFLSLVIGLIAMGVLSTLTHSHAEHDHSHDEEGTTLDPHDGHDHRLGLRALMTSS